MKVGSGKAVYCGAYEGYCTLRGGAASTRGSKWVVYVYTFLFF